MELEKEIKQSKFKNEYMKMLVNIIYTGNWLSSRDMRRLRPWGISPQQYNILRILRGQHPRPARIQLLSERMLDKMSNASRLVEKLRQKGLVDRNICEHDRRAVDVCITEKGLELLKEIDAHESEWEKEFHTLTPEEARELNRLLDKLRG